MTIAAAFSSAAAADSIVAVVNASAAFAAYSAAAADSACAKTMLSGSDVKLLAARSNAFEAVVASLKALLAFVAATLKAASNEVTSIS